MTCDKKSYESKQAAEQFAIEFQKAHPDHAPQYSYSCEHCSNWHLSTVPPEVYGLSKTHAAVAMVNHRDTSKKAQVLDLKRKGFTITQTAEQTGISYQTAYNYCVEAGLHVPSRTVLGTRPSSIKPAMTIESLELQERELRAKLQDVERKHQQLVEAKTLKVSRYHQDFRIEKEGNVLVLDPDDAERLVEKLTEYLTEPQPKADTQAA